MLNHAGIVVSMSDTVSVGKKIALIAGGDEEGADGSALGFGASLPVGEISQPKTASIDRDAATAAQIVRVDASIVRQQASTAGSQMQS